LESVLAEQVPGTKLYCCGPAPLLAEVERLAAAWPVGSVRIERFVAAGLRAPVRSEPFDVHLLRSVITVTVQPGMSVLDAITSAGVPLLASCKQGLCGTCETPVISGVPDHRDSLLTDDERARADCLMPCVSRACSDRLVLDL
jgi:ferredoxin